MLFKKANEQTALQFSKWKDENYIFFSEAKSYRKFEDIGNGDLKLVSKTVEELFNEWNNLNQTT